MNTERFLDDARLCFGLKRRDAERASPAECERPEQCIALRVHQSKFSSAGAAMKTCGICPPRRPAAPA